MKNLIFLIFLLFTQISLAEIALYTADSTAPRPINEMGEILEKFTQDDPEKNILFYVHGRGQHLKKDFDRLPIIESIYNVKVVMLHWDAWTSRFTRPVANAAIAAESLAEAFKEIRDFKESRSYFFMNHSISLLCHSMGNLVLKNFTEKYLDEDQYNLETPLFENYIGTGADVPLIDHQGWLQKFDLAQNKNIIMNNRDLTLLSSYFLDLKERKPFYYRLGLGFDNYLGKRDRTKNKLVKDVTYIDLSGVLNSEHGYFLPKTELLKNIFSKLSNGKKFEMSPLEKSFLKIKIKVENNILYILKK